MIKTLLPFIKLYRKYIGWIFLGLLLSIVTIAASLGLLMVSGWFLAASSIAGIVAYSTFNYLLPAAFVRGLAISRTAFRYFERVVTHEATFRLLTHLRISIFKMIFPRQYALNLKYRQADLLNRLISDVETLDNLYLRVITPFLSGIVIIIGMTTLLSFFNFGLALLLGSILMLILLILPPIFYRLAKPLGLQLVEAKSNYRDELNRFIQGQSLFLLYGKWNEYVEHLSKIDSARMQTERRQAFYQQLSSAMILILAGITVCLMIFLSATWIYQKDEIELFQRVVIDSFSNEQGYTNQVIFSALAALFVFASLAAFEMLIPISQAFAHLGSSVAAANRLNEIMALEPLVEFRNECDLPITREIKALASPVISLRNVSFTYPKQLHSVMNNLDLEIYQGEKIAIMGHTGAGKSTLFYLLTRAYDKQRGDIFIEGREIATLTESTLRNSMSVVPQRIYLFNDSLRDNLVLAHRSSGSSFEKNTISDHELKETLISVGLGYLNDEEGLDQIMGDGGRTLSGGELRRIGIARALIHNSDLWLLDEPTEGLDEVTEERILDLIFRLGQHKTIVMITHKTKQINRFDKVWSVNHGEWTLIDDN